MNDDTDPINTSPDQYSDGGFGDEEDSYRDFENDKLTKEIMKEAAKKEKLQQNNNNYKLPEYMRELNVAPVANQILDPELFCTDPDPLSFENPIESDRVYEMGTDRKLFPKETELTDMKAGKQDTKSTYGSSVLRRNQFLEDQNESMGYKDSSFT